MQILITDRPFVVPVDLAGSDNNLSFANFVHEDLPRATLLQFFSHLTGIALLALPMNTLKLYFCAGIAKGNRQHLKYFQGCSRVKKPMPREGSSTHSQYILRLPPRHGEMSNVGGRN